MSEALTMLLDVALVLNYVLGFAVIFFEKKNPATTWAWLLVVALVPYFGSILYFIIGFEGRKHITFRSKATRDEEYLHEVGMKEIPGLSYIAKEPGCKLLDGGDYRHLSDLLFLNKSAGGPLTVNNSLRFFNDGNDKFSALMDDIKAAKNFVHLEYYILKNDGLGNRLMSVLTEAAERGVEVMLLVDGMGTWKLVPSFFRDFRAAGGELSVFLPPRFIRINFRDHRKLAIIDGTVGYIGGFNIGDEYIGQSKRFGNWRDGHLRIEGDAVKELELRFEMDWNHTSERKIKPEPKYFPVLDRKFGELPMQIVSSGPDTRFHSIHHAFIKMIMEANKSVYIQTPYFAPDDSVLECLRIAALAGIDVRIVIPKHPDHFFVYWASTSYLQELVSCGVKAYLYDRGFLHSKILLIDGKAASVGTANMDLRSFKLNFEISSFIYDAAATAVIEEQFLRDLDDCIPFDSDKIDRLSVADKVRESVSRLISPLL